MKKLIFKILLPGILLLMATGAYAQPKTEAEAKEMAQKLMKMTPAQIMKFRDSMMKSVMQKQAKALPNGNQLLIQHHYDTTHTTVHFMYTKKVSEYHTDHGGSSTYLCVGKSLQAPMMYEADGHTVIQCAMNPPGANTEQMDKTINNINNDKK